MAVCLPVAPPVAAGRPEAGLKTRRVDQDPTLLTEGKVTITKRDKAMARVIELVRGKPIPSRSRLRKKMPRMKTGSEKLVRKDRDAR